MRATATESAKVLKQTLTAAFPGTKFSVRLSRGTGYGYCHVAWTDGPTVRQVDAITNGFEGEGFDGMTDCQYSKDGKLPDGRETGLRGILTGRRISATLAARLVADIAAHYHVSEVPTVSDSEFGYRLSFQFSPDGFDWQSALYRRAQEVSTVVHRCESQNGCDEATINRYTVTDHAGTQHECDYCAECATLAAVDWNGETAQIVPA